jgi:NAD-dependent deacetylase
MGEVMKRISISETAHLDEAVALFRKAKKSVALTGAGISVESGIDDFRSPGGLWSKYSPEEYATLSVFRSNPKKAWKLYRDLGVGLIGKKPNGAHLVLADLEKRGLLKGVVTQNIDNLHQDAGSRVVLEIHGDHRHLQCISCGDISPLLDDILQHDLVPHCTRCNHALKPNVVLFEENVRHMDEINTLLYGCDVLLVIGTSAQVYPAASFPEMVKGSGGYLFEFNIDETVLTRKNLFGMTGSDYFFQGRASVMLQMFAKALE